MPGSQFSLRWSPADVGRAKGDQQGGGLQRQGFDQQTLMMQHGEALVRPAFLHNGIVVEPAAVAVSHEIFEAEFRRVVEVRLAEVPFPDEGGVVEPPPTQAR